MSNETGSEIYLQEAANISMQVGVLLAQGGHGSDKTPLHSSRFSGDSSGGRDTFGRVHLPSPFH